jgi:hypothetical protein
MATPSGYVFSGEGFAGEDFSIWVSFGYILTLVGAQVNKASIQMDKMIYPILILSSPSLPPSPSPRTLPG